VVRKCRPPIPPLHPRIRSFMDAVRRYFSSNTVHAVPIRRRGGSALPAASFAYSFVECAPRIHAMKIEQIHFYLIPLAGTVQPDRLMP